MLHGHRRRPLVLSADRGRGKSSLLGLAAAELLRQQPDLQIVVTAPSQATVATLFTHATNTLEDAPQLLAGLSYCSPDRLVHEPLQPDLLLVDEAAAIPTPLLEAMLARHGRIVFATTEHGYEGTGRGFHLRFKRVLDRETPGWQEIHLAEPIRWSSRDPLEPLVFRLLGLNAEVETPPAPTQPGWRRLEQDALAVTRGCCIGCSACWCWPTTRPHRAICATCWKARPSTYTCWSRAHICSGWRWWPGKER